MLLRGNKECREDVIKFNSILVAEVHKDGWFDTAECEDYRLDIHPDTFALEPLPR
jgi:hypothetical protein